MTLAVILALTFVSYASASDIQPISITASEHGQGRMYTFKFNATSEPVVLWGDGFWRSYVPSIDNITIATLFSNGQGHSTLIQNNRTEVVTIWCLLDDIYYIYKFDSSLSDLELPVLEITSPVGRTYEYTPPENFTFQLQYTRLPSEYSEPELYWWFLFMDNYRTNPILEYATSFDQRSWQRYMSGRSTVVRDSHYDDSVTLSFEWQQGMVNILTKYTRMNPNMEMYKGTMFYIKQAGQTGPFREGFLDVSISINGDDTAYCSRATCRLMCDGIGPNIVSVEIHELGKSTPLSPLYMIHTEWFTGSEYQLLQVQDYSKLYVCEATNSMGHTARKVIKLSNIDEP